MDNQQSDTRLYQTVVVGLILVVIGLLLILLYVAKNNDNGTVLQTTNTATQPTTNTSSTDTTTTDEPAATDTAQAKVTCRDVTSYDYDWNNDVLCTNPDGSTFYTDYAGGNKYGYNF